MQPDIELMGRTVVGLLALEPAKRRAALNWIIAYMADRRAEPAMVIEVGCPLVGCCRTMPHDHVIEGPASSG